MRIQNTLKLLEITQCRKVIYKKVLENINLKIRKGIFKEICGKHS